MHLKEKYQHNQDLLVGIQQRVDGNRATEGMRSFSTYSVINMYNIKYNMQQTI